MKKLVGVVVGLLACVSLAHAGEDSCTMAQLSFEGTPRNWVDIPAEGGSARVRRQPPATNSGCATEEPHDQPAGMFDDARAKVIERDPYGGSVIEFYVTANPTAVARVARWTLRLRDHPESTQTLEFRQVGNPNATPPISNDASILGADRTCSNVKMTTIKSGAEFKRSTSSATDTYVWSPNRQFKLVWQWDGNLVLYKGADAWLWDIMKDSKTPNQGGRMVMQTDGNLVSYDAQNKPLWSSKTQGKPGAFLAVQDDGNLVIYAKDSCKALWAKK